MPQSHTDQIRVVGFDPSLLNWGIATGWVDPRSCALEIDTLSVTSPVLPNKKQVRNNSRDLEAAKQLSEGVAKAIQGAQAIFVEVPVGSQSARAMASYGICVGILGALRASSIPFFELTPTEIKLAGPGKKTATKIQMIQWATKTHPDANWPTYKRNGEVLISEGTAEHMADAVAAIHAGIASSPFQQLLTFLNPTNSKEQHANHSQAA